MQPTSYIGNNDYRGYLAAQAKSDPNSLASTALSLVGNDGKYDPNKLSQYAAGPGGGGDQSNVDALKNYITGTYGTYNQLSGHVLGADTSTASGPSRDTTANDQQIQSLQDQLNSTLAAQTGGLKSIDNSYNASVAGNTLTHNRAQTGYDTQIGDTQNAEQGALGAVDTNARTLNNSLRRIIGLASGANSSAYQFAAPNAVARQASGQRENTLNTYGLNLRDVNSAKTQEATDFQTLLDNLAADKQAKIQGQNSSTDTELIKNYGSLADAAAAKAAVQGGDQNAARQPYLDQIAGKQAELARFLANPIAAPVIQNLNPTTPNLRDYTVDKAAINATNQGGPSTYSPYSFFLQKKDQQVA